MKSKLYSMAILLAICGAALGQQPIDERDSHTASAAELAALTFNFPHRDLLGKISSTHKFEFVFASTPSTATKSVTPCMNGGTCGTAVTSTTAASEVLTVSGIWDYFTVTMTWTGAETSAFVNITGTHSSFLTLTTIGSSGAATYTNGVLNIPQYTGGVGSGCTPGVTGAVLKGDGLGGCIAATAGTDYVIPAGNTATATLLQNARLINGVSFNGGADITVTVPIASGVSGLGTGIAAFLATPSSANLAAAITNETGTGVAVFNTSPTLVTPILGVITSGDATNLVNLNASQLLLGTIPTAATAANTGDATKPAGSSVVTVVGINSVNLAGLTTGLLKITTGTGVPSIGGVADVSALIKTLTGCSTTAFVYTPQDNQCVAVAGGTNPMTTLGDETYGGAAGALTRLAGPTTTGHVFALADIPVGGAAVAETWYDLTANVPLLASANTFTATQTFNGQITENQQDTTSTHGFTLNNSAASRLLTIGYDATPTLQVSWGATRLANFTGLATVTNAWSFSSMLTGTVATIASATTIAPVTPYVIISGTTTVTTITAPTGTAGLVGASFDFETTSAVPFTTGGNIASPGFTTVALTPYRCTFMGTTNASWYCK